MAPVAAPHYCQRQLAMVVLTVSKPLELLKMLRRLTVFVLVRLYQQYTPH